mmetsp:Transcript_5469/g.13713  ORF Transcript_5469/g.13713 Transcript_5469/m.13713 type:complete len:223 (-) Transcript_5469:143-811(-)
MKIFLITALAIVAASSVNATDEPYTLRATETNTEVLAELGKSCSSGERDGRRAVNNIFAGNCQNALDRSFTRDVNRVRDRRFSSDNARNWRERAYNECARNAIKGELDRIGRKCRNSGQAADDCNDLGKEAARMIVRDDGQCRERGSRASSNRRQSNNLKKFRRECRSVAYGKCQGFIRDAIDECGGSRPSLRVQSRLQDKCRRQVNSMTGRENDVDLADTM